jgi:hypothetical protein
LFCFHKPQTNGAISAQVQVLEFIRCFRIIAGTITRLKSWTMIPFCDPRKNGVVFAIPIFQRMPLCDPHFSPTPGIAIRTSSEKARFCIPGKMPIFSDSGDRNAYLQLKRPVLHPRNRSNFRFRGSQSAPPAGKPLFASPESLDSTIPGIAIRSFVKIPYFCIPGFVLDGSHRVRSCSSSLLC